MSFPSHAFPSDQLPAARVALRIAPGLAPMFELGPRRFLVADSNRLARDVVHSCKRPGRTHLRELIDSRELIVFVPDAARSEVPRALAEDFAPREQVPLQAMLENWERLLECITVVSAAEIALLDDPSAHAALRRRDPDDVPFAVLADALGAPLLTTDRDLLELYPDRTIAELEDLQMLKMLGRELALTRGMPLNTLFFTTMLGQGVGEAVAALAKSRAAPYILGGLAIFGFIYLVNDRVRERVDAAARRARDIAAGTVAVIRHLNEELRPHRTLAAELFEQVEATLCWFPTVEQACFGVVLHEGKPVPTWELLNTVREFVPHDVSRDQLLEAVAVHPRLELVGDQVQLRPARRPARRPSQSRKAGTPRRRGARRT